MLLLSLWILLQFYGGRARGLVVMIRPFDAIHWCRSGPTLRRRAPPRLDATRALPERAAKSEIVLDLSHSILQRGLWKGDPGAWEFGVDRASIVDLLTRSARP